MKYRKKSFLESYLMKMLFTVFFITFLWLWQANAALAGDIQFEWDANAESELTGYRLYYGNLARPSGATKPSEFDYGNMIDVLNVVTYTVAGLSESSKWCFALTAYGAPNTGIKDSGFSNEVCMEFKIMGNPKNVKIIKITIPNP